MLFGHCMYIMYSMNFSSVLIIMLIIFSGACVQSALGFGTTMITMAFLPLLMDYSKAMGLTILLVTFSTVFISVKLLHNISPLRKINITQRCPAR